MPLPRQRTQTTPDPAHRRGIRLHGEATSPAGTEESDAPAWSGTLERGLPVSQSVTPPPDFRHHPVMLQETLQGLAPKPGGFYIDATFGGGGHTRALLAASAPGGQVLGIDQDPEAIAHGKILADTSGGRLLLCQARFSELAQTLALSGLPAPDGILFDLGVSSHQLDTPRRGFSFRYDAPLDMRMNQDINSPFPTAATLLRTLDEKALADIFFHLGEERHARKVARTIVEKRRQKPIATTGDLISLLEKIQPPRKPGEIHPATRVFQALRMAVNRELEELDAAIAAAIKVLKPGGRVAIISFHSLEDGLVKRWFRHGSGEDPSRTPGMRYLPVAPQGPPPLLTLTAKPLRPSEAEMRVNPRSRSARLRLAERRGLPGEVS
ncbi:MAG: 16S rRNA (cytosine(1402)-N(4))-methyltransferase RsmH [Magnetococcales bacterium]|nr:16S rRNA (cytosine(1402)-N(4))-methyltransferase RsmH [Magnetococcales bacterium]